VRTERRKILQGLRHVPIPSRIEPVKTQRSPLTASGG
jgi:hypothetical protein